MTASAPPSPLAAHLHRSSWSVTRSAPVIIFIIIMILAGINWTLKDDCRTRSSVSTTSTLLPITDSDSRIPCCISLCPLHIASGRVSQQRREPSPFLRRILSRPSTFGTSEDIAFQWLVRNHVKRCLLWWRFIGGTALRNGNQEHNVFSSVLGVGCAAWGWQGDPTGKCLWHSTARRRVR